MTLSEIFIDHFITMMNNLRFRHIPLHGVTNLIFSHSHFPFCQPINSIKFFSTKNYNNNELLTLHSLLEKEEFNLNFKEFKCKQYILTLEYLKKIILIFLYLTMKHLVTINLMI
jgi:hypothetical protein